MFISHPDIVLQPGTSVNLNQIIPFSTNGRVLLQSKGNVVFVTNIPLLTGSGFRLINGVPQIFDMTPQDIVINNPYGSPVTVAVVEIQ